MAEVERAAGTSGSPQRWALGRRDLLRAAAVGAVALFPLSACIPQPGKEAEYPLIAPWRTAVADLALIRSVMGQFPADAKEAGVLGRIADSRSTHVDKLAEAIGAAGHDLPDPNQAGEEGCRLARSGPGKEEQSRRQP